MTDQDREAAQRSFEREDERFIELTKASLDSAREAIRALLILNGGAAIALLGFLASTFSQEFSDGQAELNAAIMKALSWFAAGAFMAVFTSGLAYIVNSLYAGSSARKNRTWEWPYLVSNESSDRCFFWGWILNWIAVGTAAMSLAAFVIGLIRIAAFA